MKKYIHSLFLALFAISAVIGTASCSTDEEQGNDSATVSNITLNDTTYITKEPYYYLDPVQGGMAFCAVFQSNQVEKPIMFILYYSNDYSNITYGENLDNDDIHIAFLYGAGSINNSAIAHNYTSIEHGNVTALPYSEGRGLKFNNLKLTTSSNPNKTYTLNGTISYNYKILGSTIE